MSFLDRFKKQEEKKNAGTQRKVVPAAPKTIREEREAAEVVKTEKRGPAAAKVSTTGGVYAHSVLLKPIVSEKSAHLHAFNQYVFKVSPLANKVSVKKAIKETYNADPLEVRIVRMRGKMIMSGRTKGVRNAYKKAIVRMPKGVTLPIYEGV